MPHHMRLRAEGPLEFIDMAYCEDISLALIRVLEHASFHKGVRLAGYAANIDYWAAELRHALDCIAGYDLRFRALVEARVACAKKLNVEIDPSWITPTITGAELRALEYRLLAAATHFFRLCRDHIERAKIIELEQLLGIRIEDHRGMD